MTQEAQAVGAQGTVVSLDRETAQLTLTLEQQASSREQREQDRLDRDQDLREWLANKVVPVFLKANVWTLVALVFLAELDQLNLTIGLIKPDGRIIGGQVIIALLGATAVQVGAIAYTMARYLFPTR